MRKRNSVVDKFMQIDVTVFHVNEIGPRIWAKGTVIKDFNDIIVRVFSQSFHHFHFVINFRFSDCSALFDVPENFSCEMLADVSYLCQTI